MVGLGDPEGLFRPKNTHKKQTFGVYFNCTYSGRLVPGEHPPGVPVHVAAKRGVFGFAKSVQVLGGQAGRNLDEHVAEGEGRELRIPAEIGEIEQDGRKP